MSQQALIIQQCIIYLIAFKELDGDLVSISGLNKALVVAMGGLVGDPAGLLWVVRLGLKLILQLGGDDKPWAWVGIRALTLLDVAGHVDVNKLTGNNNELQQDGTLKGYLKKNTD